MLRVASVLPLLCLPALVHAQGVHEEARLRLDLGWADLQAGAADRALESANASLRLDPLLYDALVLKGLCYEQLGDPGKARAMLTAYLDFTEGFAQRPEAREALARLGSDPADAAEEPTPTDAAEEPATDAAEEPTPIDAAEEPTPTDPAEEPPPTDPAEEPATAKAAGMEPAGALRFEPLTRGDTAKRAADRLDAQFQARGFVLDYHFTADDEDAAHAFVFSDLRFYVKIDEGELRIKSKRDGFDTIEKKIPGWKAKDQANVVHIELEGLTLRVGVNRELLGEWAVLDPERPLDGRTDWKIEVDEGTIDKLVVRPVP